MNKKKLAKGKFGKISEVSKWDIEVDQDTIEEGAKLTRTWYRETEKEGVNEPVVENVRSGEYTTEDGRRLLVDSDGIVRMVFEANKEQSQKMSKKINLAKTLLASFKAIFDEDEQKFTTATLEDGTVLKWEGDLAEGVAVMQVTDEGEISAEDKDYTLEDGTMFTVSGGLVSSITPASSEENEFDSDKFKQEISELIDAKLDEFKTSIESEFGSSKGLSEKFEKLHKDTAEISEATLEAVIELSAVKPTKAPKKEVNEDRPKAARAVKMFQTIKDSKKKN